MQKTLASQILESALALGKELNKVDALISRIEDGREKKEFVDALGDILGTLTARIVFRIIREYPELDPDK
jgi:hypothetical protein